MRAFWDCYNSNFGDMLTRELCLRFAGVDPDWAEAAEADLVMVGSVLEAVPDGWTGTVLGSGLMFSDSRRDLSQARVLALRGRLTAERTGVFPNVFADPGLLAGLLLGRRPEPEFEVGVIRHYIDPRGVPSDWKVAALDIDVLAGVDQVVAAAARCRRIISSSLHGLILADSLGIENWWDPHREVLGDGFKFRDYGSSFGEELRPGRWRLADQDQVRNKQAELIELFQEVGCGL